MLVLPLLLYLSIVSAEPLPHDSSAHSIAKRLPETWYHAARHPVHTLFKRGGDGQAYPTVGSPEWASAYPNPPTPGVPLDGSNLPVEWVNALNAAVAAGTIPNISQSQQSAPGTNPFYPNNQDPTGPTICSGTYKCRIPTDIWDAPEGFFGTGFDDGPQPATTQLMQFLQSHNETSTHFMIGINIINFPDQFNQAFNAGGDIAVHTYTHPYMTTLSNMQVLAELGWTMQLIHNSTGGRVPKYWRPPYGDTDVRVSAIAREVFGMTTILWNQDTEDWSLTTGGTTAQAINASMTKWLTGPKNPGLIILEHELSDQSVGAFMAAYPVIKANGWNMKSVTQLQSNSAYWNADSSSSDTVTPEGILFTNSTGSTPSGTGSPSSATNTGSSSTSSSPSTSTVTSEGSPSPNSSNQPSAGIPSWRSCGWFGFLLPLGVVVFFFFS